MSRALLPLSCLLLLLLLSDVQCRQVRSAPGLVSAESLLPHASQLWKKGLCDRVARQTQANETPECQPIGSKVDCGSVLTEMYLK